MDSVAVSGFLQKQISHLYKLASSVTYDHTKSLLLLQECLGTIDVSNPPENLDNRVELIAAQADVPVDMWVYFLNGISKKSINVYNETHRPDYLRVLEFTIATGYQCSDTIEPLNYVEVKFLIRMLLSELQELAYTATKDTFESVRLLQNGLWAVTRDELVVNFTNESIPTNTEYIAVQQALVGLNMWEEASKMWKLYYGINIHTLFDAVMDSNMAKRDPETGEFIRRADGKIIKPKGWMPPDLTGEIQRQLKNKE